MRSVLAQITTLENLKIIMSYSGQICVISVLIYWQYYNIKTSGAASGVTCLSLNGLKTFL